MVCTNQNPIVNRTRIKVVHWENVELINKLFGHIV